MSKTPEELCKEWCKENLDIATHAYCYRAVNLSFLAGHQAAAPKWISVKDRLPEMKNRMSEDVLILDEYGQMSVEPFEIVNNEIVVDWGEAGTRPLSDFTHWMPLPEPPKEEG